MAEQQQPLSLSTYPGASPSDEEFSTTYSSCSSVDIDGHGSRRPSSGILNPCANSAHQQQTDVIDVLQTLERTGRRTSCFVDDVVPPERLVMSPCRSQRVVGSRRESTQSSASSSALCLPPRVSTTASNSPPQQEISSLHRAPSPSSSPSVKVITSTQCPSQLEKPEVKRQAGEK